MLAPSHKPKTCAQCETKFTPVRAMQVVCSPICAKRKVAADKAKGKRELRERKAALKRIPDLIKEAQVAFNAYIRARDRNYPCICCGKPLAGREERAGVVLDGGGEFDAGHYRSVGSASHLRFHEHNCHGQRKACNRWGAGRAVDYRIGLIARIGREAVEALEAENVPHKWQRDELIAIRDTYRQKLKEIKA